MGGRNPLQRNWAQLYETEARQTLLSLLWGLSKLPCCVCEQYRCCFGAREVAAASGDQSLRISEIKEWNVVSDT